MDQADYGGDSYPGDCFVRITSPLCEAQLDYIEEPKPRTSEEIKILFNLVGPVMINLTSCSVGLGLASALDTLCSQAYGAKAFKKIGLYFQTGVLVLGAVLVPVFVINWHTEYVLQWFGQDQEVSRLAGQFSRYLLPGIPFLFAYELVRKVLQAQNMMAPLAVIAAIGNGVNVTTGYVLAYHTSLGFNRIAIGCSLGYITLALLLIPYFVWRPHHLHQWWVSPNVKAATRCIGTFMRFGVPSMLMLAMEMWGLEVLAILSGLLPNSVVAVASHSMLVNVNLLVYTTFEGFSVASNIRVGNCLGAGMANSAKVASITALKVTFTLSSICAVLLYGFSGVIPHLFLDENESADLASKVLAIWSPFTVVDGLNCVLLGVFQGAGKQTSAAITNASAYYAAGIPVGAFLAFQCGLGVEGLWIGTGVGDVLVLITLVFLMVRCWNWKQLTEDAKELSEL